MTKCPACSNEVPEGNRSCPSCQASLDDSFTPTVMQPGAKSASTGRGVNPAHKSGFSVFDSIDEAKFIPGTMLIGRYRIVGLLGKGGMGEVYRADDLKLTQPVALKFLPERLAGDGAALARFHREARVARQVSHPNVCRVFDIGEVEGQHFLSMEYIDGEDLATLMRRIGRLPTDKSLEIARQLCAGLAAAHDNGVLHRDLKPANVMIDGRGKARITDFGLAGLAGEFRGDEIVAGTPAYMAPEQLVGKGVSIKSDIYSLGLVLYELFTGKRAFDAATMAELIRQREEATLAAPSTLTRDIDPLVEQVILTCLEQDPDKRPQSALNVARALPGGDPLAAALAAGETPSPEMVASAKKEGALRPAVAVALLASLLAGLALVISLSAKVMLHRQVPFEKSPEVLADRASSVIKRLGYWDPPASKVYGLDRNYGYIQWMMDQDGSHGRWDQLRIGQPYAIYFWYRQSPTPLEPSNYWKVSMSDPPPLGFGMVSALLDTEGRLVSFRAVPYRAVGPNDSPPPDWSVLFTEAGLDISSFTPSASSWIPPIFSDRWMAWDGAYPDQPQIPLHIEAGAYRGKPVYFTALGPWSRPAEGASIGASSRYKVFQVFILILIVLVLTASIALARRNLRLGRGDRKGAFRLAIYVFVLTVAARIFDANVFPTSLSVELFTPIAWATPVVWGLWGACTFWLLYIALEPYLRHQWPYRIISWSRVLAGKFRDPLVGRDILIGALFGIGWAVIMYLRLLVPKWLGWPMDPHFSGNFDGLLGIRRSAGWLFDTQLESIAGGMAFLFLLLLLYMVLRRERLAAFALGLIFAVIFILEIGIHPITNWLFLGLAAALVVVCVSRFGLLATVTARFFFMWSFYPHTSDFSAWHSAGTMFVIFVVAGLAVYSFKIGTRIQDLGSRVAGRI